MKLNNEKLFSSHSQIKGGGKPGECLVPECHNKQSRRGLCNTHRINAKAVIRSGKTTEKNLISRGLLLEKSTTPSNKRSNPAKKTPKKKTTNLVHCIYPKCTKKRHGRGLCKRHYSQAQRELHKYKGKSRKMRENDLVKNKLMLPKEAKLV